MFKGLRQFWRTLCWKPPIFWPRGYRPADHPACDSGFRAVRCCGTCGYMAKGSNGAWGTHCDAPQLKVILFGRCQYPIEVDTNEIEDIPPEQTDKPGVITFVSPAASLPLNRHCLHVCDNYKPRKD